MYGFVTTMFLLSRPPIYHPIYQQNHIVCDSLFINQEKMIQSQNPSLTNLNFIDLPIDNIFQNVLSNPPPHDKPSVFHRQRYESIANKEKVTYEKFCSLEKSMADIIETYALDKKHHWCIFVNKNFLYGDSFRRFLTKPAVKNIMWISDSVEIGFPDMVMWNDERSINI